MKNNGMIEYKEKFISRIKHFFMRLFNHAKTEYSDVKNTTNLNIQEKENEFFSEIKIDNDSANKVIERKEFLNAINGNREMLNMLSIEQLKKLKEYYINVIETNDRIIRKLEV